MNKIISLTILSLLLVNSLPPAHAGSVGVSISSPAPESLIPLTGVDIVADGTPAGDKDCLSFDWTDTNTGTDLGAGNPTGNESTLHFTPTDAEQGHEITIEVDVTDDDGDEDYDDIDLEDLKITSPIVYSPDDGYQLWYILPSLGVPSGAAIGDEQPQQGTLYVSAKQGSLSWSIAKGSDKVSMVPSSDNFSAVVTSTNFSSDQEDVEIDVTDTSDSEVVAKTKLTVLMPDGAYFSSDTYNAYSISTYGAGTYKGYSDTVASIVKDQFGDPVGSGLYVNESFTNTIRIYTFETWSVSSIESNGQTNASGDFEDFYASPGVNGGSPVCFPLALWNTDSGASTEVVEKKQTYRAGSMTSGNGRVISLFVGPMFDRGYAYQDKD